MHLGMLKKYVLFFVIFMNGDYIDYRKKEKKKVRERGGGGGVL